MHKKGSAREARLRCPRTLSRESQPEALRDKGLCFTLQTAFSMRPRMLVERRLMLCLFLWFLDSYEVDSTEEDTSHLAPAFEE